MLPYYILLCAPILLFLVYGGHTNKIKSQSKNKFIMAVFFAILIVILALREKNVGIDITNYLGMFSRTAKMSFAQIFKFYEDEQGYYLLNKLISFITVDNQWFLVIMALITTIPVAVLYIKESENPILTISIFITISNFSMLFSALRQSMALAVVAISYYFIKHKKPLWFILFILLAITFHKSAFVAFLLYPFYHMNITRNKLLIFVPITTIVLIFNKPIFKFLLQFMNNLGYEYEYKDTGAYMMIILFALFLALSYIAPKEDELDMETKGLRGISVLALMIQIFALTSSVAMRMNCYTMMFYPILIPKIINRASERNKSIYKIVGIVMALYFIADYIMGMYTGVDTVNLYPYKAFWQ